MFIRAFKKSISDFILQQIKFLYSDVVAWVKSQMTEENSDSDYHSENDIVLELKVLRETLNNHVIDWPEVVDERDCSGASSSCYLASITECCEKNNENDQSSLNVGESKVNIKTVKENEEAEKRLEKASKLLDDGNISLTRFLQMLDPTREWFPENSKYNFEFENVETKTIEFIMKDFYGPDWSSPFQFEFNGDIEY